MSGSNTESIRETLRDWIVSRLEADAAEWLLTRSSSIRSGNLQDLYLGFGLVSRKIPKSELGLTAQELARAEEVRPGWQPGLWSVQDAARTLFILEYAPETADQFVSVLDRLFAAGEVHELIALYQALPVLPYPERHRDRVGEGIRTNMQSLFRAVAHQNPYPSEQLSEGMWNQMVLKCLFIGAPLHPVVGLETRINSALSQMLCDYAHERWSAGRTVSAELWRCVRPEMTPGAVEDLARVIKTGNKPEQQAAALSLASSESSTARELLNTLPEMLKQIKNKSLNWNTVSASLDTA